MTYSGGRIGAVKGSHVSVFGSVFEAMWKFILAVFVALFAILGEDAIAQQAQKAPPRPSQQGGAKAQVPPVPHPNQLAILIRSTLLAVNQANLTGNYSVLRELGTDGFQASNNTARLGDSFKWMRDRKLDLGPVAILAVKLRRKPTVSARGQLRLTGYFPSRPERVNFDLAFYNRKGRWLLDGIAVNMTRSEAAATGKPSPQAKKAASAPSTSGQPAAAAVPNRKPSPQARKTAPASNTSGQPAATAPTRANTSAGASWGNTVQTPPPEAPEKPEKTEKKSWGWNPFSSN